jgi:hypothetical protein
MTRRRKVTINSKENRLQWCEKSGCIDNVRPVLVHRNRKIISGKGWGSSFKPLRKYHPCRIKQLLPTKQNGHLSGLGTMFSFPC